LVTDDVIVVHGDGRCIRGRNELKADFQAAFEPFRIDQRVHNPEVVIRGDWHSKSPRGNHTHSVRDGEKIHAITMTMVAMRWRLDGAWKVARVVGLPD
jgi:ketosteroid isomerase-like protein